MTARFVGPAWWRIKDTSYETLSDRRNIMTTFNKATITTTRERLQTALDALGADLGCEFKVGNAAYEPDGSRCSFKLDCAVVGDDGTVRTKEEADFVRLATQYGLAPDDLGREFTTAAARKTYTLSGCLPRNSTYPIIGTSSDGRQFKLRAEVVRKALGYADPS